MQVDANKKYPNIPFTNHLVFRRVMRDPKTARGLLERILHIEIDRIEYCNTEQTYDFDLDAKGVRLDLYVRDSARAFNVEMQTQDFADLGTRMAYYQTAINSGAIERGGKHFDLPESFIIFLCTSDPFGYGCPLYTFEMVSKEVRDLVLDTRSQWLVFNAAAYELEEDESVRSLLKYMATEEVAPKDSLLRRIDEKVRTLNRDKELMAMASLYMSFEEDAIARGMLRGRREGREEGEALGEARLSTLISKLLGSDRIDDIKRVTTDDAYRQELFKEFGIA